MKRRYLIMLIIAIVLVLCVGAGFAFAYFFTDAFKSNKTLFFKYFSQNSEIMNFINDDAIKTYSDKQKQTPYTSEGTIKTNVTFPDSSEAQIANALQNCNISFSGKVDNRNKYFRETIKANYSDNQSLQFELYRNNDVFATKIADVLYKYLGIENNNLKDFAKKMNLPENVISALPNKIEINNISNYLNVYSKEDFSSLKDKYLKIITDNLTDDMFSKEKNSEEIIYSITLNQTQFETIIVKLLEALKEDEIIINKVKESLINNYNLTEETINPYIDKYKEEIQSLIDNLNSESSYTIGNQESIQSNDEANITIKVHSQKRKLVKTEFTVSNMESLIISKSDDGIKVQIMKDENEVVSTYIQKIKSPNETKFELVFSLNNNQIFDLTTGFSGLDTNSVHENSELSFDIDLGNSSISDAKTKFVCSYQNTKTFGDFQKEEIQNQEILLLNTAPSKESIESLYKNIENKFIEVNRTKLQSLGLKDNQNPFIYYAPSVATIGSTYIIQNPDKAPYFSIPIILAGSSITLLSGENTILSRANKASKEAEIAYVKEDIMLAANEALSNYYSEIYGKNTTTNETPFSFVEKTLKNFKSNYSSIEYTYNNKIITLKDKNNSTTITGTLSDKGEVKWNQ